jgi:hypothetical protein
MTDEKPTRPASAPRPSPAPLINEEADSELGRIMVRYGLATIILAIAMTIPMAYLNTRRSVFFAFLDGVSALVPLLPFFFGIKKMFVARLRIGRELLQARKWKQAVAALEPFAGVTQRFLDSTGEAHYLLASAYDGLGEREKALKARAFVLNHRPGPWAEKLKPGEAPRISQQKHAQEKRPATPNANTKRKKRF